MSDPNEQLPTLAALEPVSPDEVLRLAQISPGGGAELATFGLGWYRVPSTNAFWLGSTSTEVHDHDRWLLALEPPTKPTGYLYRIFVIRSEFAEPKYSLWGPTRLEERAFSEVLVSDMLDSFAILVYEVDKIRRAGGLPSQPPERLIPFVKMMETGGLEQLARMPNEGNLVQLHNLVRHTEIWRAAHPESAGLPQELLERMHGMRSEW